MNSKKIAIFILMITTISIISQTSFALFRNTRTLPATMRTILSKINLSRFLSTNIKKQDSASRAKKLYTLSPFQFSPERIPLRPLEKTLMENDRQQQLALIQEQTKSIHDLEAELLKTNLNSLKSEIQHLKTLQNHKATLQDIIKSMQSWNRSLSQLSLILPGAGGLAIGILLTTLIS